ncbi:hypothetical protein M3Y99_01659200 [Aphelenchoides fujianensis]|nr:hypothetical protein M3Y99_01659200 [Aphelenchoides fujianensis]
MVSDGQSKRPRKKTGGSHDVPYKYTHTIFEQRKTAVYGAAFNPYLEANATDNLLATCGGRYVSFQDPNKDEGYYAVTWAIDEIIDKHVVVVGGAKGIIRVLDPVTKDTCNTLRGHGEAVNELRTSPMNAMIIASASKDRTARLWNIRSSDCLAIFGGACGHLDEVISLDFDQDQQFLLTASMDHTIRVWDMRDRTPTAERVDKSLNGDTFPLAICRDVHTNYVDCGPIPGELHRLQKLRELHRLVEIRRLRLRTRPGDGTLIRTETYVLHCAWMDLPKADTWFIKFDLHPNNSFVACGNEAGPSPLVVAGSRRVPRAKERPRAARTARRLVAVGENGSVARYDFDHASNS